MRPQNHPSGPGPRQPPPLDRLRAVRWCCRSWRWPPGPGGAVLPARPIPGTCANRLIKGSYVRDVSLAPALRSSPKSVWAAKAPVRTSGLGSFTVAAAKVVLPKSPRCVWVSKFRSGGLGSSGCGGSAASFGDSGSGYGFAVSPTTPTVKRVASPPGRSVLKSSR